ncbi:protein disulfide-isomerase A5 [Folsomia candida]|uniref:Protein disulfide-isomerase A3 n=1 Tax=Folsomia candida TaxID=158441 RepID=A0A226DGI6_FOLCA|nr:protein disulfide-isomerase A5 [Folsomia candida]OXA44343.1 Protein disulfide-isomerase A3 [Folsomia candida]
MLLFLVLSTFFALSASQKCLLSDPGETGGLSDADFWAGVDGKELIEELTDDTHDKFVSENDKVFILYYMPKCPHCKKVAKPFGGAAKKMNDSVKFGGVDCVTQEKACAVENHPVEGCPTFYLFKGGEWNDEYTGKRTTDGFVRYLKKK